MKNLSLVYRSFGSPIDQLTLCESELQAPAHGQMRVAMTLVPINPSDLIPITGAYAHRIQLPSVAGYEGVGTVILAPSTHQHLVGRRVLPLRGVGTWQSHVDCDAELAVPVPDGVDDTAAARAYINPLAALNMLNSFQVAGKNVLLTGAGSACAQLLAFLAKASGARKIVGDYRSASRIAPLRAIGVETIAITDLASVQQAAKNTDVTFDCLGGPVGSAILSHMQPGANFVGYGLLSGRSIQTYDKPQAGFHRFHLRDTLADLSPQAWQDQFKQVWAVLHAMDLPPTRTFDLSNWKHAIAQCAVPGAPKPLISFNIPS